MNHKTRKMLKAFAFTAIAFVSAGFFTACDDEIDQQNRFTFKGELISTYLEKNPERFSSFTTILSRAKLGSMTSGSILKTLSTYGSYTCFAPTNEAVEAYLQEQYDLHLQGDKTGIHSPYLEDLTDSMATVIAKNHIIEMGYLTTDVYEGSFPMSTMNNRITTVEWYTNEAGRVFPLLNNSSLIIEQDLEMENGYVQVVDGVLSPSSKLLPELIEAHRAFSLFSEAIKKTGIDSLLNIFEYDPIYEDDYQRSLIQAAAPTMDSEPTLSPIPKEKKQRYTVLIEPDELFHSKGINTIEDMAAFAEKWYGTKAQGDYENPENALHQFILYHIIDRQLLYSSSTGPGGFIMENYNNEGYSSEVNLDQNFDSYEYYETMLPYTMVKVTKPYTNESLKREIVINYGQEMGTAYINQEMAEHINVVVVRASDAKKENKDLSEYYEQGALNGIIHTIDRILVYNEEEMAGNVLNERIRMDVSALFPELTNNGVRWDLQTADTKVTFLPEGYMKGFRWRNETTEVFYFRPHQTWGGTYANFQGDEFIVEGAYDFEYRIPHVPEGIYELRFGYPQGYNRGICQFYVDGQIAGIPVDLRLGEETKAIIGWEDYSGLSEDEIKEKDKGMRNRGWMKGPASIILEKENNVSMRDGTQPIRKINGTYRLNKGDHWMRFKDVSENSTGKLKQFDQDYLELVPLSVINNQLKPEDIY